MSPVCGSPFTRPEIWVARSPDLMHWGNHAPLDVSGGDWQSGRVGAGPPPIRVPGGWLALYTLRLDSTLIAFEYCLRQRRSMELMKLSFHPDFARYSPGNVLRFTVLEREIESFGTRSYHMGPTSEWKARWATRIETQCRLRIYRPGVRGTLAYVLGSWVPGVIRRHGVLRSTARWLRQRAGRLCLVAATAVEAAW